MKQFFENSPNGLVRDDKDFMGDKQNLHSSLEI